MTDESKIEKAKPRPIKVTSVQKKVKKGGNRVPRNLDLSEIISKNHIASYSFRPLSMEELNNSEEIQERDDGTIS